MNISVTQTTLMHPSPKFKIHFISIYFAVLVCSQLLIWTSPLVAYFFGTGLPTWFIASGLVLVAFWRFSVNFMIRKDGIFLAVMVIYVIIQSLSIALFHSDAIIIFQKTLLFLSALFFLAGTLYFSTTQRFQSLAPLYFLAFGYLVIAYAFMQVVAHTLGVDLQWLSAYRGRDYGFVIPQVSSFYAEPAFLALFLLAFLYYALYLAPRQNILLIALIFLTLLLSRSVGGILAAIALLSFCSLENVFWRRVSVRNVLLIIALIASVIFLFDIITHTFTRFDREVVSAIAMVGAQPWVVSGSGATRVIGELNWVLLTLRESPLFGFGVDYGLFSDQRLMALNAIAEVTVRWGAIGLGVVIGYFAYEKLRYRPKSFIAFAIFIVGYVFIDGAVAKLEFWLPLALVIALERGHSIKFTQANQTISRAAPGTPNIDRTPS